MENTYSHNCAMHGDMMLKSGRLFDLATYVGHTKMFQRTWSGRELVAPH